MIYNSGVAKKIKGEGKYMIKYRKREERVKIRYDIYRLYRKRGCLLLVRRIGKE